MTKQFTAKQMHNAPGQVFRAADKDGRAKISHEHYKDRDFFLTASEKKSLDDVGQLLADNKHKLWPTDRDKGVTMKEAEEAGIAFGFVVNDKEDKE